MQNHTHENRQQWRDMYEQRVQQVLNDPRFLEHHKGMWNYKLAFYIRESALLEAIPENGAIYRCSYWNGLANNQSHLMGSVVVTAESELDAHLKAGKIANQTGSPFYKKITVKELPPNLAQEGEAEAHQLRAALQSGDQTLILFAKQLMQYFLGQQIDRDGPRSLFLGSITLHCPMADNPSKYIERILDAFPLKVYYHIESLGLFVERWCRFGYGIRHTERRMIEDGQNWGLQGHQFSFDQRVWDKRLKPFIDWPDPRKAFQDRYIFKNESPIITPPKEVYL